MNRSAGQVMTPEQQQAIAQARPREVLRIVQKVAPAKT
jgi:hypothetical protein